MAATDQSSTPTTTTFFDVVTDQWSSVTTSYLADENFAVQTEESAPGSLGLEPITHGPIWTPDVVQRVATLVPLMVATLLGNVVIVVVLSCSKHRKTNSRVNIFIVNLALGDLSVLGCTMTTEVLFVVFEKAWVLGATLCKLLLYGQIVTLASTTFILTSMSFDRYLAICRPLVKSRPKTMIVVSWLLAFIFATPQLLIFMQVPVGIYPDGEIKYKCRSLGYSAWWQRKTYFTLLAGYILVMPAIIITFCYINVARVVWSQGRADVAMNGEGVALRRTVRDARFLGRAKIKTIKMTLSIICAYIGCWTPYFVVHLIHIWSEYKYTIPDFIYVSAETLALVNSAVNPILYGCFNLQLKRGLTEVCCGGQSSFGGANGVVSVRSLRYQLSEFGRTPTITMSRRTLSGAARRSSNQSMINISPNQYPACYSNRSPSPPSAPLRSRSTTITRRLFHRSLSTTAAAAAAAGTPTCTGTNKSLSISPDDSGISFITSVAAPSTRTPVQLDDAEEEGGGVFKLRMKFTRANSYVGAFTTCST